MITLRILSSISSYSFNVLDAFTRYQRATGAVADNNTGLLRLTTAQFANLQSLFFTINGVRSNIVEIVYLNANTTFPRSHLSSLQTHKHGLAHSTLISEALLTTCTSSLVTSERPLVKDSTSSMYVYSVSCNTLRPWFTMSDIGFRFLGALLLCLRHRQQAGRVRNHSLHARYDELRRGVTENSRCIFTLGIVIVGHYTSFMNSRITSN